ncbi:unnamed protein product [Porites evermanni]|uniref:Uncharacterized protein n=1 Tax=Porites evermanni TaxID=104178 RepID=A0ABN8RGR4_9CNID|nr:unnamed protein product [Porites evermanni]
MQAKKVMMGGEAPANTIPVISVNYTKPLKGFKRLQATSEDFGQEGKQSTSERLVGKPKFEAFLRAAPKSVGVFTGLHEAYEEMTKSPLFKTIEQEIQSLDLDVRSQRQI